jgi:hypothetical protein
MGSRVSIVRSIVLGCGLVALTWIAAAPTHADRREDARAAADRGDRAFAKGAFDQALTEYQTSYDKYPKPFLLFRIGECHRNLGHDADALAAYQKYATKVAHGGDRKKAAEYISALEAKIAAQKPADIEPEPEPPVPVAQSTDVEAPPQDAAQQEAADRARHKKQKKDKNAPPAETTATAPKPDKLPPGWDPSAPPPEATPVPEEPEPPRGPVPLYKKWWLWTIVGGVAVVGVGVTLGLVYGLPKFTSELPIGGPGASALTVKSLMVHF